MRVDFGKLLDAEDPPRLWHEAFFGKTKKYGPRIGEGGAQAIAPCLSDFFDVCHKTYSAGEISAYTYAKLLTIHETLHLCAGQAVTAFRDVLHMIGHLAEASMTEQQEEEWRALVAEKGKGSAPYKKPVLSDVVDLLIGDVIRWKRMSALKGLFEFAYFGYVPFHQKLLDYSLSEEQWGQNLTALVPYLIPRHYFRLPEDPNASVSFLSSADVARYADEEKKLAEHFANAFTVLVHFDNNDVKDSLAHFRQEYEQLCKEKGRIEARKHLIFLHRNRLWIPTYFYKELSRGV